MEVILTGWMDKLNERWSELTGIPADELSTHLGGEGLGVICEIIAGWTTKGWLNKLIQGGVGALATAYALLGRDIPTRFRAELLQLGAHEMSRAVPMNPTELEQLRRSFGELIGLAKAGKMGPAMASGLYTPIEYARAFGTAPVARTPSPPSPPRPPAGTRTPSPPKTGGIVREAPRREVVMRGVMY